MSDSFSFFDLFFHPIYRGPFWGGLFMSISTALVGAIAFLRKKSLVGEALSHAAFPGVALGMIFSGLVFPSSELATFLSIMIGAFVAALIGQSCIESLLSRKQKADVTLCYILASFLGAGVLLASWMQQTHPLWYQKIQRFFYGQAATMTDLHIYVYGGLSALVILVVSLLYRAFQSSCFDPLFSETIGIKESWMKNALTLLLSLAIVIGIRSTGVVLVTGMLIAPPIVASCFTHRFSLFLIFSAVVGALSSYIGSTLSIVTLGSERYLPTGPVSVLVAASFAFLSLLFSPKRGYIIKVVKRAQFQKQCLIENILKHLWKTPEKANSLKEISLTKIASSWKIYWGLWKLRRDGFIIEKDKGFYTLTEDGRKKAAYIIRLHRLWELYLMKHLGTDIQRVHQSAEEMEHLITPDLENQLTELLLDPTIDPHEQPIPQKEFL